MKKFSVLLFVIVFLIISIGCASATNKTNEISQTPKPIPATTIGGVSGIIGTPTMSAIATASAVKTSEQSIVATTKPAVETTTNASIVPLTPEQIKNGQYLITINLTTYKITLLIDNKKIKSFDVCTGTIVDGKSLTPSGQFHILKRVTDPYWGGGGYAKPIKGGDPKNPLGHYWIGLSMGKVPGGTYGIHGNIDESSIGKPLSHGCVRMHNDEIGTVFKFSEKCSDVWIGTTAELTSYGAINFD